MNRYFRAKVLQNIPLNNKNYLLTVKPLVRTYQPLPGQFYMIEVSERYDPLMKRPFSFFRKTSNGLQFLYTVRGKGTMLMKNFQKGKVLDIVGPLGNGYPKAENKTVPLFVAGGTGIASIYPLIEKRSKKACVLYGAQCESELLMLKDLKKTGKELFICTDDGSCGYRGTTVDFFDDFLHGTDQAISRTVLYACGPTPMLRRLARKALKKGVRGYVSLEENMACGLGACLGCAVKTTHGYKRVCKEGPVFPLEEIVWEET